MRRVLVAAVLLVACKGETTKQITSATVGKAVEITKATGTGILEGINQGRKSADSADGSKTISSPAEVLESADLAIHEVRESGNKLEVVIAVTNKTATALHLLGMNDKGGAQLLDSEGFASAVLPGIGQQGDAITVPPSAKVKASIFFEGSLAKAAQVRLWGKDFPIPQAAKQKAGAEAKKE